MRETALMQWRMSQTQMQRESAWMFDQTVATFEATLDGLVNEIIKAETQA